MKLNLCRAALVALGTILMPLTMSQSPNAATFGDQFKSLPSTDARLIQARSCSRKIGPFMTQYRAIQTMRQTQARGYTTGPVYGEGGLLSNYSNRRWYFTVYFAC